MTISVLVPCYNGEKFIEKCLNSVLNQSHKVDEIIIVNDGSTDNSLSLIEKIKENNSNIKIVNQENKGLAKTRNILISHVRTKYFYFLDADDWLEPNCMELFHQKINEQKYDLVFAQSFKNNKIDKFNSYMSSLPTKEEYAIHNCTYVWNILINFDFWKKNNLSFYDEYPVFEDVGIFAYLISKSETTGFIKKPIYHYFINKKSLSRGRINEEKIFSLYMQINNLYSLLNKEYNKKYPKYINDSLALNLACIVNYIIFLSKNINKIEWLKKIKKMVRENGKVKFPKCYWKFWFFLLFKIFL